MQKLIYYSIFLFLLTSFCHAQEISQEEQKEIDGLFKEIDGLFEEAETDQINNFNNSPGIQCQINFKETSGNNILDIGETGILCVKVINNTFTIIQPKLEIFLYVNWSEEPIINYKSMNSILPDYSDKYKFKCKWSEKLPTGTMKFKIKAIDTISDNQSDPVEISFQISGAATESNSPFVETSLATSPEASTENSLATSTLPVNNPFEGKYNRKSVTYLNHLLIMPETKKGRQKEVNLDTKYRSYILKKLKEMIEVERFDYNPITEKMNEKFITMVNSEPELSVEKLTSICNKSIGRDILCYLHKTKKERASKR